MEMSQPMTPQRKQYLHTEFGPQNDLPPEFFLSSPEEKRAITNGHLAGRATVNQLNRLYRLGYEGDIHKWSKYRASMELEKLQRSSEPTVSMQYDHLLTCKMKKKSKVTGYLIIEEVASPTNLKAIGHDGDFYIYGEKANHFDKKEINAYGTPVFMLKKDAVKIAKERKLKVATVSANPRSILAAGTVNGQKVVTLRKFR